MFCKNCGAQNPEGTKFCSNCGASLQEPAGPSAPQQPYQQQTYQQPPYQQPAQPPYQPPAQPPLRPVQGRSLAVCIILTIVTCGIYGLYWLYMLQEDMNALTGRQDMSGGMVILLSIVTCGIYSYIWAWQMGEKVDSIKTARGIPSSNSGIVYLLLSIFGLGIVTYSLIQNEINQAVGFQ